jgi:hypothetical protein
MKCSLMSVFAVSAILSSCGFSAEKCVQADWYAIGQSDGQRGASDDRMQKHIQSCAKHDVTIDQNLWRAGQTEGLKTYCTEQSAYRLGRDGRNLKTVCPDAKMSELRAANEKGRRYHAISREIEDLMNERADLRAEIRSAIKDIDVKSNTAWLRMKVSQIDLRIWDLKRQRQQYDLL